MTCLENILSQNIIGIRDYKNCDNPLSGLYINDIEGISLKTLSAVTNSEHESGYQFAKDIINRAVRIVVEDFKQFIFPQYNFNSVVASTETGHFDSPFEYNSKSATSRGVCITRGHTKLGRIFISKVDVLVQDSGVIDLMIEDGNDIIHYTVNATANVIETIFPEYQCQHDEVYIYFDQTNFRTSKGDLHHSNLHLGCRSCSGNWRTHIYSRGYNGVSCDSNMYGINTVASLRCDETELICAVIDRMYYLMWIKSGIEFYKERLISGRLNPIVMFSREIAEAAISRLEQDYDVKYKIFCKSIQKYLSQFKDICLTCNAKQYVQSTP